MNYLNYDRDKLMHMLGQYTRQGHSLDSAATAVATKLTYKHRKAGLLADAVKHDPNANRYNGHDVLQCISRQSQ